MTQRSKAASGLASVERSGFFGLSAHRTTIWTEILAGLSTYLSVAYIFIVNPAILAKSGIDPSAALFATAAAATVATIAMALWANLPFAVAPGLTMNSYFVFVVCQKMHFTWQQALATVFLSGAVCVLLTAVVPVRQRIVRGIPIGLKRAIAVTVGVFVSTIGLYLAKVVTFGSSGWLDLGKVVATDWTGRYVIVLVAGLATAILLNLKPLKFPGALLVAIIVGAVLCAWLGISAGVPPTLTRSPLASIGALDFSVVLNPVFWLPVLVFFVLDFFEGIGEFIGMTARTTIQDEHGNVTNLSRGLYIDGFATMLGSLFGTSSLIIFVESAVGIKAGGRTGLTALTCGLLMLLSVGASIVFAPALSLVPAEAAAGVLVYVGYLLLSTSVGKGPETGALPIFDGGVALGMSALALGTLSLDKSLAFGFGAYFVRSIFQRKPMYWLAAMSAILVAEILWQNFGH